MIKISERSKREIFIQQLDAQGQADDLGDFSDADIDDALIDDSIAHFLYLLIEEPDDDQILNILALTRAKLRQMKKNII